jgi:hypothetical protein
MKNYYSFSVCQHVNMVVLMQYLYFFDMYFMINQRPRMKIKEWK